MPASVRRINGRGCQNCKFFFLCTVDAFVRDLTSCRFNFAWFFKFKKIYQYTTLFLLFEHILRHISQQTRREGGRRGHSHPLRCGVKNSFTANVKDLLDWSLLKVSIKEKEGVKNLHFLCTKRKAPYHAKASSFGVQWRTLGILVKIMTSPLYKISGYPLHCQSVVSIV